MSREQEERSFGTADLVAATRTQSDPHQDMKSQGDDAVARSPREEAAPRAHDEPLAALFPPEMAGDFQSRWDAVQIGFVDDPKAAVRQADELVAQVMKSLAESFANERDRFDAQLDDQDSGSTENMRVALRRYRSFFQRLLSL